MTASGKLTVIKVIHTAVWVFFNVVLFYLLYAAVANRLGPWVWIGLALIGIECLVLVLFKMMCPLTVIARQYSTSREANFDIYLPNWLAQYNKHIYGSLLVLILGLIIWRVLTIPD